MKQYFKTLIDENLTLAKKIRLSNSVEGSSETGYSFIIGALKILHPNISNNKIKKSITDGSNDGQIDAIVFEKKEVFIYDFKKSEGFKGRDVRLFIQSTDRLFFEPETNLSQYNSLIIDRVPKAVKKIENGHKVRIRVIRTGDNISNNESKKEIKNIDYDSIVEKKLYTGKELIEIKLNLNSPLLKYNWSFKLKRNNPADKDASSNIIIKEEGKIKSLICRIPLKELVLLYNEFQPNPTKIFEANVRGFQNNRKISNQILLSLSTKAKSKTFYKLHNGITIVGDSIMKDSTIKFNIENPQIVNGCQTLTTIGEHYKHNTNAEQLELGSVLCKIFASNKNEVGEICLASNSQVAISSADLRTNDDIQIIIESYLNMNKIKYDRKVKRINKNNEVSFQLLGQWLCSCFLYKPAFAKNSKSKIFDASSESIYHKIFNLKMDLEALKTVVEYGIYIIHKLSSINKEKYHTPANLHFLTGLYYLNQQKKWKKDYAFSRINTLIKKVIVIQKNKYGVETGYPSIFTKYEDTWRELKILIDNKLIG
jgi:AIPR protein